MMSRESTLELVATAIVMVLCTATIALGRDGRPDEPVYEIARDASAAQPSKRSNPYTVYRANRKRAARTWRKIIAQGTVPRGEVNKILFDADASFDLIDHRLDAVAVFSPPAYPSEPAAEETRPPVRSVKTVKTVSYKRDQVERNRPYEWALVLVFCVLAAAGALATFNIVQIERRRQWPTRNP